MMLRDAARLQMVPVCRDADTSATAVSHSGQSSTILQPTFAAIADVDGEPLPVAQFNGLSHIYPTEMLGVWVPAGRFGEPVLDGFRSASMAT